MMISIGTKVPAASMALVVICTAANATAYTATDSVGDALPTSHQASITQPVPRLSEDGKLGRMSIGPDGRMYIVDQQQHRLRVHSPDGLPLLAWGSYGSAQGKFVAHMSVAAGPDGLVYVQDGGYYGVADGSVQVFTEDGEYVGLGPGTGRLEAIGPDGTVFTIDGLTVRRHLVDWSVADTWLASGMDEGDTIADLAVDTEGHVIVLMPGDRKHLQRYTMEGRLLEPWDLPDIGDGLWTQVLPAPDGAAYLVAIRMRNTTVFAVDRQGAMLSSFVVAGLPTGFAVDRDGNLIAVEYVGLRLVRYDRIGTREVLWQMPGDFNQFRASNLSVSPSGAIVADRDMFDDSGVHVARIDPSALSERETSPRFYASEYGPDDELWVVTREHITGDDRLFVYRLLPNGAVVGPWPGPEWQSMHYTGSVAVNSEKVLHLLMPDSREVHRYTQDGQRLREWPIPTIGGQRGAVGSGPVALAIAPDDTVYVLVSKVAADGLTRSHLISRFDVEGEVISVWPLETLIPAHAQHRNALLSDLAVDATGRLYIVEAADLAMLDSLREGRIMALGPDGTYLGDWSHRGVWGDYYFAPISIDVGPSGSVIVVDQPLMRHGPPATGRSMIHVFAPDDPRDWSVTTYVDEHWSGWPTRIDSVPGETLDIELEPPELARPGSAFGVRAERVVSLAPGVYRASVKATRGVRMWIGTDLVVDRQRQSPLRATGGFTVWQKGQRQRILVETSGSGSASNLAVSWTAAAELSELHLPMVLTHPAR